MTSLVMVNVQVYRFRVTMLVPYADHDLMYATPRLSEKLCTKVIIGICQRYMSYVKDKLGDKRNDK